MGWLNIILDSFFFLHTDPIGGSVSHFCNKISQRLRLSEVKSRDELIDKLNKNIAFLLENKLTREEIFYYLYFKNNFKLEDKELMSDSLEDKRFKEWEYFSSRIKLNP